VPLEQAIASDFQPFDGLLRLGYQPGVWVRLRVLPAGPEQDATARRRVVRVGPNYLERIELYEMHQGQWRRQVRGLQTPQASRDCQDDLHCFVTEALPAEASTLYLKIEHRGFLGAQIEVLSPDELPSAVARQVRSLTVSLVIALGLFIVGLVLLLIDRSLLLLSYCCYQLTIVFFMASNAGLFAVVFPTAGGYSLNLWNNFLFVLRGATSIVMAWAILRLHQPSRLYVNGITGLLLLCGVIDLLFLLDYVQLAFKGILLVFSILPFWLLYGTLTTRELPISLRRILFAATSIYMLILFQNLWLALSENALISQMSNIRQFGDGRLNGLGVGMVFFLITLLERASQQRVKAKEVDTLRQLAQEAQSRQTELAERSGLIDMLTHELKNPLGTIRFAIASLKPAVVNADSLKRIQSIDLSARRMDDLIERVASFSKLERATSLDSTSVVDATALIQELLSDVSRAEQWMVHVQTGATFRCDRQLLWMILENLISNADKYGLPGHQVRIEVTLEEGIKVHDAQKSAADSPGMACVEISNSVDASCVPDASSLFDRYYRHPNVQDKAGMGLGLSVVKTAVQKIQGNIAYRHESGRIFFTLRVPR
jgi:signal transduction histidine kinase